MSVLGSIAVYLPKYSKMQDSAKRPKGTGKYAREVFRATELPYMQELIKENPKGSILMAMSHIHEFGSFVGHLKVDLNAQKGKLQIFETDSGMVAKALIERTYWRNHVIDMTHTLELAERELKPLQV